MSGESYYYSRRRELERQIANEAAISSSLASAINDLHAMRQAIVAGACLKATECMEGKVKAASLGTSMLEATKTVDVLNVIEDSSAKNKGGADTVSGVIDFSGLFEDVHDGSESASESKEGYLSATKKRLVSLVAINAEEQGRLDRLIERCGSVETSTLTVEDARLILQPEVNQMCVSLAEEQTAERREAYARYLAVNALLGESPRGLSYQAMLVATEKLEQEYLVRKQQESIGHALDSALEEVGLENRGTITLGKEKGALLVDDANPSCALFVAKSDDGSEFMFTTVSATRPDLADHDAKVELQKSAKKLCDKKRKIFNEILPRYGIEMDTGYESPYSTDYIQYSEELSSMYQTSSSEKSAGQTAGSHGSLRSGE